MLPPSRETIRCAVRPGPPPIGSASRTSAASQAAFSTKASGQAVAWRSALLVARSRSLPVQLPSSLSAPVSASRRCWRCCMVRLLQKPGRLGRFGGCIQPAIGPTTRLPRRRTICSLRSRASHRCVIYSRPAPGDMLGQDFDRPGHLSLQLLHEFGIPQDADFYLCGPPRFLEDFQKGLAAWGIPWSRVHVEVFGPASTRMPGIASVAAALPHRPDGAPRAADPW